MDASRRRFLTTAGALAVTGVGCNGDPGPTTTGPDPSPTPAPGRDAEPARWVPDGDVDGVAFAWPVVVGDTGSDRALLRVRTDEPEVQLAVVQADGDDWVEVQRHEGLMPLDGWLALEVVDLLPDTAYNVVLSSADGRRRGEVTRLRTAVGPDVQRVVTFGAVSCLGGVHPTWDALPWAAAEDLDFVLLLGDTVYADGSVTLQDYRSEWEVALATPSLAALLTSTSVIATWDDHEVANNWVLADVSDDPLRDAVSADQLAAATQAFRDALPQQVGPGGTGVWRAVTWGDVVEVIVLDCRGERGAGTIVSDAQLDWAVGRLQTSTATFKVVMCSVHLTDHLGLLGAIEDRDRWQGYPAQRGRLVQACADVDGVVVITGDMHYGALQRLDPAGGPGHDLWEVAVGPAGSRLFLMESIAGLLAEVPEQYAFLLEDWSVCLFEADPGTGALTVRFVDGSGAIVHQQTLMIAEPTGRRG